MKIVKFLTYSLALALAVIPLSSCSLFDRYKKNEEGFYEKHYSCCGPIALEKALSEFYTKEDIVFFKKPFDRKEISRLIQKRGIKFKEFLSYFNKDAICITCPSEIKHVVNKYGLEIMSIEDIGKLDPEKDVAIVLVHGKFFSKEYHWLVFPNDDIIDYYGDDTVIDKIYLLKRK